jgi:hypothetical protein
MQIVRENVVTHNPCQGSVARYENIRNLKAKNDIEVIKINTRKLRILWDVLPCY